MYYGIFSGKHHMGPLVRGDYSGILPFGVPLPAFPIFQTVFCATAATIVSGGVAALIGAKILGPRIGKYNRDGKPNAILGHSLTLGVLGVFILWFCWFGFNGCSTVATMVITWMRYGKPDISMTLNGSLAGLVGITAGCDMVSPAGAFFIGLISAFVVVFGIEFIDKVCKIDDPVGAIGVHGMCGGETAGETARETAGDTGV